VYKEAASYRSKMKNYAVGLVMLHYAAALGLDPMEHFRSQSHKGKIVSERVQGLIGDETQTYHFGPDDERVNFHQVCIFLLLDQCSGEKE
jgi:hypothetical protein